MTDWQKTNDKDDLELETDVIDKGPISFIKMTLTNVSNKLHQADTSDYDQEPPITEVCATVFNVNSQLCMST